MTSRFPKLVAFDLDYTLWPLWIDTHVTGPLKRPSDSALNVLKDKHGETFGFYHDVPDILHRLRDARVVVAAASRTSAPRLANQALSLLLVPPKHGAKGTDAKPEPAMGFFNQREIYPGSKIKHFKELHAKTGIPYSEMVFYDDEGRNREVESLGVTFVLVRDGVNSRIFEKGLEEWRRRHPAQVVEDAGGDVEHKDEL